MMFIKNWLKNAEKAGLHHDSSLNLRKDKKSQLGRELVPGFYI